MYPNQKDARFDFNYYQTKHMDTVKKHLQPYSSIDPPIFLPRVGASIEMTAK
jgi:hypothetical protein